MQDDYEPPRLKTLQAIAEAAERLKARKRAGIGTPPAYGQKKRSRGRHQAIDWLAVIRALGRPVSQAEITAAAGSTRAAFCLWKRRHPGLVVETGSYRSLKYTVAADSFVQSTTGDQKAGNPAVRAS